MKRVIKPFMLAAVLMLAACKQNEAMPDAAMTPESAQSAGQSAVVDEMSKPNVVQTAASSPDHTTLVSAVKQAGLVDALSNAGPFTVFAPTDAAFAKLPHGTLNDLMKPEKKDDLKSILEYHAYVGVLKTEYMQDGQEFEMVSPQKIKITKKDDKTYVNGSEIIASVETSNGIIHVINDVLMPE